MSVRYMESIEDHVLESDHGRIQILVPGEQGAFEAMIGARGGSRGRAQVQAPCVSLVPGERQLRIACVRPSDMVVMSLSDAFVRARCLDSARNAPDLRDRYSSVDPFLRRVGNTLRSGFRVRRPPTAGYLEALAGALADHLGQAYEPRTRSTPGNGLSPHRVQRVCAVIAERLGEQLHVEDLAETICMSPFHFARMFKKSTGEAPHEYLTRVRMDEAKRLLAETIEPLASIAVRVGYKTQAHFTGVFHERTGLTPRTYRVRARKSRS
jgi:AraC family transcriptional regulator